MSKSNVTLLIEEVFLIQSNMEKLLANTKKKGVNNFTDPYLRNRLRMLNDYWNHANKNHAEILVLVPFSNRDQYSYFKRNIFEDIEEKFEDIEGYLTEHIDQLNKGAAEASMRLSPSSRRESMVESHYNANVKLQRLDLIKFSGDYTKWATFRDEFTDAIHNHPTLTNMQKFQYLLANLRGDAFDEVSVLTLCGENYQTAWERLKNHYENKLLIITALLNRLTSIKSVSIDRLGDLKAMRNEVFLVMESLRNIKVPVANWDSIIIHLMVQRFDTHLGRKWEDLIHQDPTDYPKFETFYKFLDSKIRPLEAKAPSITRPRSTPQTHHLNVNAASTEASTNHSICCAHCNQPHSLYACPKFHNLSVPQRQQIVRDSRLCWNCLAKGHGVQTCRSERRCRFCSQAHHSLLHVDKSAHLINTEPNNDFGEMGAPLEGNSNESLVTTHLSSTQRPSVLLATAEIKLMSEEGRSLTCRALIDQGSQASFISESVVQSLRLQRERTDVSVRILGGDSAGHVKYGVRVKIGRRTELDPGLVLEALVMQRITSYKPNITASIPTELTQGLELADPNPTRSDRIDVLIGAEAYGAIILAGLRTIPGCTLIAQRSIFGWLISGGLPEQPLRQITVNHVSINSLDESLQKFWALEEVPPLKFESKEHAYCEKHFADTTTRTEEGRFVVRLPFKSPEAKSSIGSSYRRAQATLKSLQGKLEKSEKLREAYDDFLDEYETLGHMSLLQPGQFDQDKLVYLPHHGVYREDKLTTKLRVVFNASFPTDTGVCLNDILCIGPKLHTDLVGVLLRWRMFRFVICADIIKMFRQILVHPDDRNYQCILWQSKGEKSPSTYTLNTVTYGTAPAPFLANRVIREIAEITREQFPLAYPVLTQHIYVDDILFGADDKPMILEVKRQVIQALESACFALQKWLSNDPDLLDKATSPEDSSKKESQLHKLLGVLWCHSSDSWKLKPTAVCPEKETKRAILSNVASLFDPLGWFSPLIIKFKIFIQNLWILKLDWDDKIPPSLARRWRALVNDLNRFEGVEIPRWLAYGSHTVMVELIGFCDASRSAYSAVVYLRVIDMSGVRTVSLLMAKSRVAPLKTISIPRLELCAAVLLKTLINYLEENIQVTVDRIWCFSDSKIVLAWLDKSPGQWSTFVGNRVSSIQTELPRANWRHVGSRDNPADLNSRGVEAADLSANSVWWNGPTWLMTEEFSRDRSFYETQEEKRQVQVTHVTSSDWLSEVISRYSSWSKLLRIFGYVMKFIDRLRSKVCDRHVAGLSHMHVRSAQNLIVRHLQTIHFAREIKAVSNHDCLSAKSRILSLNPIIDSDGLLRVGGRLSQSQLPEMQKHPVILAPDSLTRRIIRYFHLKYLHSGIQLTLNALRKEFWILNARNEVKRVIHNCNVCIRHKAQMAEHFMGDLPSERCTPSRPFSHVGVDYAGPLDIRVSPGRGHKAMKGWVALFVCFSTRAIHIEVVSEYSTQAFIAAFDRFTARRGLPTVVFSDNGTNFQGASSELRRTFNATMRDPELINRSITEGVEWRFIPPSAPHFGGLWEAGVKSLKYHLHRTLQGSTPTFEELSTLTSRIEACLNSRPLHPLNDDVDSLEVLTPGHFLIGDGLKSPTTSVVIDSRSLSSRWDQYRKAVDVIWTRWKADYLNSLQMRSKWQRERPNLKVNDIVILRKVNTPPCYWPLARITATYPGKDGIVRVVQVRTANASFTRPINQICPLNTDME